MQHTGLSENLQLTDGTAVRYTVVHWLANECLNITNIPVSFIRPPPHSRRQVKLLLSLSHRG